MTESMTTDDAYQYGLVTGEFMERERIIALLEKHRAVGYAEETTHDALIALIKEENK